jgi:hypothetical protein
MGGNLLDFDHDFETSSADGVIIIGEIEIDTQGYDEDGEDDEEDY